MKNRQGRWGGKKWLDQNVWTLLKMSIIDSEVNIELNKIHTTF